MRTDASTCLRVTFWWAVAILGAVACSGTGSGSSATEDCGRVFDAVYACARQKPTADETARLRQRFQAECVNVAALPGSALTGSQLTACANAYQAGGCTLEAIPAECQPPGALPSGSPCSNGNQCDSRACAIVYPVSADGGPSASACGSCSPCSTGAGTCGPGTLDAGEGCASTGSCKPGLWCDGVCASPQGMGAPCSGTPVDCAYPLLCGPGGTCQNPGAVGSMCQYDAQCDAGLVCDLSSNQCGAVAWASVGEPCGGLVRCVVGNCPQGVAAPQCPRVIEDGQPCDSFDNTQTCDTLAQCVLGVCSLGSVPACH